MEPEVVRGNLSTVCEREEDWSSSRPVGTERARDADMPLCSAEGKIRNSRCAWALTAHTERPWLRFTQHSSEFMSVPE